MRPRTRSGSRSGRRTVTIGLINNMSDEALKVTERQFGGLVGASAGDIDVELRLFALSQTPRSPRALEYISTCYEPASAVMDGDLDALIITGAQPRSTCLSDELYWDELTELIDWAREHTVSTIFSLSCRPLRGIASRRRRTTAVAREMHRRFCLYGSAGSSIRGWQERAGRIPHFRYNGLSRSDLERAGYDVLTSSPAHGVDSFTKSFGSQFVFRQGHPEYDANSLAREYRRDMDRYLRGETDRRPPRPKGYFNAELES